MVALIKPRRKRIFTTSKEQLAEDFKQEVAEMMKQTALENQCDVEDLKFTVNNMGVVNIRSKTAEDILEEEKKRTAKENLAVYRRMKGIGNG